MSKKVVGLAAAALTGLFVLSTGIEPAVAARGGGGGGGGHAAGGGGNHGPGGGGRSFSSRSGNSGISGNRVYGYTAQGHRSHGRGNGHRRGRGFVGVAPYGYYDYGYYGGTCAYEYNRAVATGSAYWWNRYEECID